MAKFKFAIGKIKFGNRQFFIFYMANRLYQTCSKAVLQACAQAQRHHAKKPSANAAPTKTIPSLTVTTNNATLAIKIGRN